jgi:hypothetical protein
MSIRHAAGASRLMLLVTTIAVGLAARPASAAIDLSPGDIKISHVALTSHGAASWSFFFGLLKTDKELPSDAALLRVRLADRAVLRPLHGRGSIAGVAGQDRFTVIPLAPGNPLFRQGDAFLSLDAHDPDWARVVEFKRARLSVEISITATVVASNGQPVKPPLTDKAVVRREATVRLPNALLKAHR